MLLAFNQMSTGLLGEESEKDIFDKARLAFLDEKWDQAIKGFDQLLEMSPNLPYYAQVLFYKAECYKKKKMPQKALENYNACVKVTRDEFLKEQALILIIDMNFDLSEKTGNTKYLDDIVRSLGSSNDTVRWYAALMLSKAADKAMAVKAVPELKKIIAEEKDENLVDRAKIALMRIDPSQLKKITTPKNLSARMLVLKAEDKKNKKESFSLRIPFVLAQLAIESLPDKEKKMLEEKGYRLEQIINTIVETGELIKIESEDSVFRIWIE